MDGHDRTKAARDAFEKKYGKETYSEIGRIGGSKKNPKKGFGSNPSKARDAANLRWRKHRTKEGEVNERD